MNILLLLLLRPSLRLSSGLSLQSSLQAASRSLRRVAALGALALLVGCAAPPPRSVEESAAVSWPAFDAPRADEQVFQIDAAASKLRIRVDPEGPMARLGHSHIIGGNVMTGIVVLGDGHHDARLDLSLDASALEVDKPKWRADAGLETELDEAAISGTRNNMLGERVLDAQRHPVISIRSTGIDGPAWLPDVTLRIRLRGEVREVVVPVAVELTDAGLTASGTMDILQSDFGIEPFSAAGGALRVSDRMRIRFRIVAERIPGNP